MWFHRPVVCGSGAGLPLQKEAVRHGPQLCGQWFGVLPGSQMVEVSVPFLFSGYLVPLARKLPLFLSLSPMHPSPSLADEDISSRKQWTKE